MALGKDLIKELYAPENRTYDGIRKILAQINSKIYDSSQTVVFNQKTESAFANIRKKLEGGGGSSVHHKSEYLGIVIRSNIDVKPPIVYVDIPSYDIEGIVHYDQFWDPQNNLKTLEHKAFYPESVSSFMANVPREGHIVRVKVSPNYFSSTLTNPQDNRFIGIFDENLFVEPTAISSIIDIAKAVLGLAKSTYTAANIAINTPKNKQESEKIIMERLISGLGITTEQAAGIVGNLYQESRLDHTAINPTSKAFGIGQWLGSRKTDLINFAGINGGKPEDLLIQADFVVHELQTTQKAALNGGMVVPFIGGRANRALKTYVEGIKSAKTIEEAAVRFRKLYERPGEEEARDDKRIQYATSVFKNYTASKQIVQNDSKQPIPKAADSSTKKDTKTTPASNPTGRPKLKIVDFKTDMPNGIKMNSRTGSFKIKAREDIVLHLQQIKGILNAYGVPLNCEYIDARLENKEASLLGRVGLQVNLNFWAALSPDMNINTDDYFVGPDYSKPIGDNYALKVYAKCNKVSTDIDFIADVIYESVDIYNIKQSINISEPVIIKTSVPLIDLTKLFEDRGFVHALPKKSFFKFSDTTSSNWNVFQTPSKIAVGYTYKELLKTVYDIDNNSIWTSQDKTWNGSRFV
jgi:hypothetical protein